MELERVIVGSIVVFMAAGLYAFAVGQLQRRRRISTRAAWIYFLIGLLAIVALCGSFQVAERLAPYLQPYMGLVALISVVVNALIWTVALYSLFGRKHSKV
ncbi:hypothetical protein [Pseudomonas sp. F1002]|uniref:hypothetical protein n=1 Tax=Pseudomonas sp. F1002 TaxID=2738821 RepID=UPI0015A11873|nr:hypothetical protein [Pseudomonas sp. F1002]NWB63553.1 hypothetical protein [Pseudomonas sp. F1002]